MKTAIKLILIYLGIQLICGGLIGIPFTIIARMNGGSVDATRVSELTLAPSMLLSMAVMFFYLWKAHYIPKDKTSWSFISFPFLIITFLIGRSGCRNVSKKCMNRLFEYKVYPKTEEPIPFCWKVLFVLFMLGTLLAMAAVCSSCQPEEEGMEAVDMKEGLPATIRLEVQGEEQANFVTRTVNESVISDLHILDRKSVV